MFRPSAVTAKMMTWVAIDMFGRRTRLGEREEERDDERPEGEDAAVPGGDDADPREEAAGRQAADRRAEGQEGDGRQLAVTSVPSAYADPNRASASRMTMTRISTQPGSSGLDGVVDGSRASAGRRRRAAGCPPGPSRLGVDVDEPAGPGRAMQRHPSCSRRAEAQAAADRERPLEPVAEGCDIPRRGASAEERHRDEGEDQCEQLAPRRGMT